MNLSDRTKKIVYATLFLCAIVALTYILYVVFFHRTTPGGENANVNNGNVGLPNINDILANTNLLENINQFGGGIPGVDSIASGGLTQTDILTPAVDAFEPVASADGGMRYYNPDDGQFYRVDGDGNIIQIGSAEFRGVSDIAWADTSDEVILEFPDGSNIYYNLGTDDQVTLPKEFEEFDFSPSSNQIAFKYMHIDPERRVLAVSSPDGSSARTLESLGNNADRVDVEWSPTGKVAASYAEFIDLNRQEVGFIGLKGENFKGTIVEGRGLQSQYSPDGKEMLYSVYTSGTDYKPTLWMVEADGENIGDNRRELNLNTFANKCAFSSDAKTAYCGVPSDQKYGFGLEPDLLKGVPDDIYKINLTTGTKTKIATPVNDAGNPAYTVDSMVVSEDGGRLFFRDENTGQLVKITLE